IAGPANGIDADQLDAEVAQLVEQAIQLRLIGEVRAKRGLPGAGLERDAVERGLVALAQPAANNDLVAPPRRCCIAHRRELRRRLGELSSPGCAFTRVNVETPVTAAVPRRTNAHETLSPH